MNKDSLQKWVEALESGRFTQITGSLRMDGVTDVFFTAHDLPVPEVIPPSCFCALGVLVEEAIEEGVDVHWDPNRDQYVWEETGWEGETVITGTNSGLPSPVWEWLGVEWDDFSIDDHNTDVVTANDEERRTFAEIAASAKAFYELEAKS